MLCRRELVILKSDSLRVSELNQMAELKHEESKLNTAKTSTSDEHKAEKKW